MLQRKTAFCKYDYYYYYYYYFYFYLDIGNNADLYAANQESTDSINEAHMEDVPLRFMGEDVLLLLHFQPLSLD